MALMRLEPGRIPNPGFDFGILGRGYGAVGLAVLAFLLGLLAVGIGALQLAGVLLGFACSLLPAEFLIGFISGYRGPRRIKLDGLLTLRDLSYALAGQQPRRHPFSSPAHDNCGGFVPGTQA